VSAGSASLAGRDDPSRAAGLAEGDSLALRPATFGSHRAAHHRTGRRPSVHIEQLTTEQEASIRAALRELHVRLGTWRAVSEAIDISERSIERVLAGRRRPTPGWALRLAPVLGVTVDAVLAGRLAVA
jgi:hypothetical protein